jgi:hypothetical protein
MSSSDSIRTHPDRARQRRFAGVYYWYPLLLCLHQRKATTQTLSAAVYNVLNTFDLAYLVRLSDATNYVTLIVAGPISGPEYYAQQLARAFARAAALQVPRCCLCDASRFRAQAMTRAESRRQPVVSCLPRILLCCSPSSSTIPHFHEPFFEMTHSFHQFRSAGLLLPFHLLPLGVNCLNAIRYCFRTRFSQGFASSTNFV